MLVESRCLPILRFVDGSQAWQQFGSLQDTSVALRCPLLNIWGWLASGMGMSGLACVTCHKPIWRANWLVMACGNNDVEKIWTVAWACPKKTLWYPAKSIKHHKNRANGPHEFEFEWSACLDGTLYNTEFSSVPELRRIHHRGREFLEAIQYVKLSDQQIGNIRLPFYENTKFEDHENPALTAIFNAAIPQIAKILAAWDQQHPAVQSLSRFTGSKRINPVQKSSEWMVALDYEERLARVTGIGLALLHFLVVQHELEEPLNLNGDLVNDLWDNCVVTCGGDGKAALQAMYGAVNDGVLPGANEGQKMSRFFDRHTIFDSHWRPPLYRRVRTSQFTSTQAILVTIPTVSKRKAEEQLESGKGPKRSKLKEPKMAKAHQKTNMAAPGNNRRVLPSRKSIVTITMLLSSAYLNEHAKKVNGNGENRGT
ncbi:hypothetical protein B0H16DRAFT_1463242 [Mycena metata]|uniref:Uncharacterized protein n=1 Tax=Mycena metata TaxID=1033252 RepID=A0AAD7IL93_9AGAR|nr:hypothetical protein B0H16DRAFT_1463242 [Mycena metata]